MKMKPNETQDQVYEELKETFMIRSFFVDTSTGQNLVKHRAIGLL